MMWLAAIFAFTPVYAEGIYQRRLTQPIARQAQSRPSAPPSTTPAASSSSSSSSYGTSTIGYYSNGEEGSPITTTIFGAFSLTPTTIGAPATVSTGLTLYTKSSSNYWRSCAYVVSYSSTTITENASTTQRSTSTTFLTSSGTYSCPIWTDCQAGTLSGFDSATSFCQVGASRCITYVLYNSFGGMPSQTSLGCSSVASGSAVETTLYYNKPAATGLTRPSGVSQTSSSPPESSTSPPSSPPPAKDNTGAIAGGVVGGLAVLAVAGVAIFWILRRSRRKNKDEPVSSATDTPYDPYKQSPQGPVGYYEPGITSQKAELAAGQNAAIYEAPPNEVPYTNGAANGSPLSASTHDPSGRPVSQVTELPSSPVPR
ncbi:hypothetical protein DM02DRAFT_621197 [Periconia macrospinosa]|uniref:Mid2 domain-containing protein n=1 Tax=Periconia macrospinosa TaxID=97972 RepID=A0A2V1EFQ3_9PLEO|nr:hypothetical protein DM02DRAFT_621197 [Periconia macrospinosa]